MIRTQESIKSLTIFRILQFLQIFYQKICLYSQITYEDDWKKGMEVGSRGTRST